MPIIEVAVLEGRDHQTLERLATELHNATTAALGVPEDSVRILVREVPATHWIIGGVPVSERRGGMRPAPSAGERDTSTPGGDVSVV